MSDLWQFSTVRLSRRITLLRCLACSALVDDPKRHALWHATADTSGGYARPNPSRGLVNVRVLATGGPHHVAEVVS